MNYTKILNTYGLRKLDFSIDKHNEVINNLHRDKYIVCYTDGSCYYKTEIGGFGILIVDQNNQKLISKGPFQKTTTSKMEINAILFCLKELPKNKKIVIFSDSQYCVNSINEWARDWDLSNRKNGDLFKDILSEIDKFEYQPIISWVPGHLNIDGNEIVDTLASKGRKNEK